MKKIINKINMGLMKLIAMGTPSCEAIGTTISESFDRSLTIKERMQIKIHLLGCEFCLRYRDQLVKLHQMASKLADDFEQSKQDEIKLDPKIKLEIKKKLKNHHSTS